MNTGQEQRSKSRTLKDTLNEMRETRTLLLATPLGSMLHGFHHAGSDEDTFELYDNAPGGGLGRSLRPRNHADDDFFAMPLRAFFKECDNGSLMPLEAMFSQATTYEHPLMMWYRSRYRATHLTGETLERSAYKYLASSREQETFEKEAKHRRHAMRLSHYLLQFHGRLEGSTPHRFNPTLPLEAREAFRHYAQSEEETLAELRRNPYMREFS